MSEDLKAKLEASEKEKKRYFQQVLNRQVQISELQERINAVIGLLESIEPCLKTYAVSKAIRVLKGEHND